MKKKNADSKMVPRDFNEIRDFLFHKLGMEIHELSTANSSGYDACHFKLDKYTVEFRSSKITPKKTGQFVAIWRRNEQGLTQPFEETDPLDLMIISSRSDDKWGLFIFPKSVLIRQAIINSKGKTGKRGIRVYPPWEETTSGQAEKTQRWQGRYFVGIQEKDVIDRGLFCLL